MRKDILLPELIEAANQQGQFARFNPTKPTPGENLPSDLYKSSAGFLLSKEPAKITLNLDKIKKEIAYFSKQVIIAYFLGGPKKLKALEDWMKHINREVKCESRIGRQLGQGFFQIISRDEYST